MTDEHDKQLSANDELFEIINNPKGYLERLLAEYLGEEKGIAQQPKQVKAREIFEHDD